MITSGSSLGFKSLWIIFVGISLVFLMMPNDNESELLLLILIFGLITILPFVFLGDKSVLSGINIFLIYLFVSYGIGAFTSFHLKERNIFLHSTSSIKAQLIYAVFASLFLLFGYYIGRRRKASEYSLNSNFSNRFLFLIALLSILGKLIIFQTGNYFHSEKIIELNKAQEASVTGFNQIASLLNWLTILGMMISFYNWKKLKIQNSNLYFFFFFLSELLYAIPTGSKEKVLLPLIFLILVYTYVKKFPFLLVLFVGATLFLFIFPFYSFYRSSENQTASVVLSFNYFLKHPSEATELMDAQDYFNQRMNYADIQAVILEKHEIEHKPYLYGKSYSDGVIALVPRIIWPDKPNLAEGNQFGRDYGLLWSGDTTTSVGKYLLGESFMNFGWNGVFVFLFFGYFLAYLKQKLLHPDDVFSFFIYSFLIYQVIRYDQFSTFLGTVIFSLLFFVGGRKLYDSLKNSK